MLLMPAFERSLYQCRNSPAPWMSSSSPIASSGIHIAYSVLRSTTPSLAMTSCANRTEVSLMKSSNVATARGLRSRLATTPPFFWCSRPLHCRIVSP